MLESLGPKEFNPFYETYFINEVSILALVESFAILLVWT